MARQYMAAMQAGEWVTCARLMHSDALAAVRRLIAAAKDAQDVAEVRKILGLTERERFADLSDTELFARFLRGTMAPVHAAVRNATITVIGSVRESPDVVHVVIRVTPAPDGQAVSVNSLKLEGGVWRILLLKEL